MVLAIRSSPAGALDGTAVPVVEVEDPDGDGVSGLNDQFPDDPERATLVRYPSAGRTILGFEDNYPNLGDGDYNDAVVAVWFELTLHADGRVKDILGQFSLVARGASYDSSVGLHVPGIPANATGTLEFERFGSGADAEPTLETHRTIAEFVTEQRRIDDVFLSAMQALPPALGEAFTNTRSTPDEPNAQPMVGLTMRADGASGMTADDAAGIIGALQADGGAGFGTGSGRLGGSNRPPAVGRDGTSVQGSLSRDVIQRMVRVNVGRIRQCYEHALQKAPNLTGRVSIRFVIGPTGKVVQASDSGSTLGDPGVIACVLAAVRRISFPSPTGGGPVVVTYPFVFSPGTGASPATPPAKPAPKTGNP